MINTIKRVKRDWNYLYEKNYKYAKVTFFNKIMDVKTVTLKEIEFTPLFNGDVTIERIKKFYVESIDEKWNMKIENFNKDYENLVELVLYSEYLIILKFEKQKYYNFFNIKKGYYEFGIEKLFIPYLLKLSLEYTTNDDKIENGSVKLIFGSYINDTLIISKVISNGITLKTDSFNLPDFNLILNKDENINKNENK